MQVKISVIMPVLNGMPYFEKALKSVQEQSLREIEIIIVDGGSSDDTLLFAKRQRENDKRIIIVETEIKSMGYQYNLGISYAKGDYLAFCESDDHMSQHMLKMLYEKSKEFPKAEIIKTDFWGFRNKGSILVRVRMLPRKANHFIGKYITLKDIPEIIYRDTNMWNGIYKRVFIQDNQIKLNESKGAAFQDTGFVEQSLLNARNMIYLGETNDSYWYRKDNVNASTYKDVSVFVMQEHIFMMDYVQSKHLEREYGAMINNRFFPFFCDMYGRKIVELDKDFLKNDIEYYRNRVKKLLDELGFLDRNLICSNPKISAFFEDWAIFRKICEYEYLCKKRFIREFLAFVQSKNNIIIFSAGEKGEAVCAFLKSAGVDGNIFITDNSKEMQGKSVCGEIVTPVEKAIYTDDQTAYVVPSLGLLEVATKQLMRLGVEKERITVMPYIDSHNALEIQIV